MTRTKNQRAWVSNGLVLPALVLTLMLAISYSQAPGVRAANGDLLRTITADRTGTNCVSTGSGTGGSYPGAHGSVGVGIAFDGTDLLISCYSDNTVTAVSPANGSQVAVHVITGASSLGALAWDNARGLLWACSSFNDVGTIDLATNVFTFRFSGAGCFDGLAYDGSDDSIWSSADASSPVSHYTAAGAFIASFPVNLGGSGNSGIAVGGSLLYLANNGGQQIYTSLKDFSSAPALFATFPSRLEDLECDNVTFPNSGAIWSIDAYDNILNAYEIPDGSCDFGGGGGPTEHPGSITGPLACGTYVRGGENSGFQDDPGGYTFQIPSPLGISGAGTVPDHHWVHTTGTAFVVYDMGAGVPAAYYIPSIDHGPIPGEAMEATLYGTNNLGDPEASWEAGTISDIYAMGFDPAWISDDFATRWTFSQSYRYIGVIHGGPGAIVNDGDAEIDAICGEGINLTPAEATNPVLTSHTVTATALPAGLLISFSVVSGPNAGATGVCTANANCTTDANGNVSWTYTGNNNPGMDVIEACLTVADGTRTCARATKTWAQPDIQVTKSCPATVIPGNQFSCVVTVKNNGPVAATGVTLTDTVTGGTLVSATPSQGTCSLAGNTATCNIGNLASGASATVTVVIQTSVALGTVSDTATGAAAESDPNPGNNTATATTGVVVPASTVGCKITDGGRITAANGDKATFGGNAQAPNKGQQEYQDHGPAIDINVHSISITAVVCSADKKSGSIFGTATINGAGSYFFRIDVQDLGEPGTSDTYRIRLSNGYDSGVKVLTGGNIQIHK